MINTLAQSETDNWHRGIDKPAVIVIGRGSPLGDEGVLKSRAKRKTISQTMALNLIRISDKKEDYDLRKAFWNTYHCQNRLVTTEGRYYGKYCKNRCCTLCCSIRKAALINKYSPEIRNWEEPYFVTITIKACPAKNLKKWLEGLIRGFKKIVAKYRKRNQRGKGIRLIGIRSLECNFNPLSRTYNPHFHLIVPNKVIAETIINEWLGICTPKLALRHCQDMRPVADLEHDLVETIKYGCKIFTQPDLNKKSKNANNGKMYVTAHYNIFEAMKGLRLFDRFGFDLPKNNKQPVGARVVVDYYEWKFLLNEHDWQNTENELVLSGFVPNADLVHLLANNIDREAE